MTTYVIDIDLDSRHTSSRINRGGVGVIGGIRVAG